MEDKYTAFYACNCEYKEFETFELAEKWLREGYDNEDEGFSEETMHGADFIAKITHRSKYIETDNKDNYHEHDESCLEDGCDEEVWDDYDFDSIGNIIFESTKDGKCPTCQGKGLVNIANSKCPIPEDFKKCLDCSK